MYFIDMLTPGHCKRATQSSIPFESQEGATVGGIILRDGVLTVGDGENLFAAGLAGNTADKYLNSGLTFANIADTEDNPIVIVRCSKIGLYSGQEVSVKFLYCGEDYFVAALVYGSCEFDRTPLQRCSSVDLNEVELVNELTPSKIKAYAEKLCVDAESGYCYLDDCVFQLTLLMKKSGESKMRFENSGMAIFDKSGIERAQEKHKQKIVEEERKRREWEEYKKEQKRIAEEKRRLTEEKKESELKAKQGKITIKSAPTASRSCSAKDFLAAVRDIKNSQG